MRLSSSLLSSKHLEKVVLIARRGTEDGVDILLVDDRAGARASGFGLELRAQIVHVRLAALDLFGALDAIPANGHG